MVRAFFTSRSYEQIKARSTVHRIILKACLTGRITCYMACISWPSRIANTSCLISDSISTAWNITVLTYVPRPACDALTCLITFNTCGGTASLVYRIMVIVIQTLTTIKKEIRFGTWYTGFAQKVKVTHCTKRIITRVASMLVPARCTFIVTGITAVISKIYIPCKVRWSWSHTTMIYTEGIHLILTLAYAWTITFAF